MLVSQMHVSFKVGIDKTDVLNSANFLPEEIDLYLSDAQEEFIEQRAYGNNFKRLSIEETQKRVKDLQSIQFNTNISTFITNADNKPNGVFVELPLDYRHADNEEVTLTYLDCNNQTVTTRVPVAALTHDEYNRINQNPFATPNLDRIYRLPFGRFNNREHYELIKGSNQTLVTYHLRYLKNPTKIDLAQILTPPGLPGNAQGDLTDESYREIIRLAIRNAMGDIQAPGAKGALERMNEIE